MERASDGAREARVGLCVRCVHGREVQSGKGAVYWLCGLSQIDARYRKYPTLPVIRCTGFERKKGTLGSFASEGDA